jgi:hypothetical protein
MTMASQIPSAPKVRIFLRDDFRLKTGGSADFLEGVGHQLQFAQTGGIALVAACSQRPFDLTAVTGEPPPAMMHIWEMPEWHSLYDAMYGSSENSWYEKLEGSISRERQELLVNLRIGYGTGSPVLATEPHVYLYEEITFKSFRVPNAFQRALNQFALEVGQLDWKWLWCATQVTAQPQLLCLLWSAPDIASIESALTQVRAKSCYETMMSHVATLKRRYMYPTEVESL